MIFEIETPGTFLDYDDSDWAWNIYLQLESLKSHFFQANTALNLFMSAPIAPSQEDILKEFQTDSQRRSEIRIAIEKQKNISHKSWEDYQEIDLEIEKALKLEKWAHGHIPREFNQHLIFIYIRAFLYAIDTFEKILGVLSKEKNVPEGITNHHARIAETFPHLRGIRNSTQHIEDRLRGLGAGRPPQPIDIQPFKNGHISASGSGALVLGHLHGSTYGCTKADGHYGEIDISPESLQCFQEILQTVLSSFKWRGPKQHSPHA